MARKKRNLCHLVQRREIGFVSSEEKHHFYHASVCLADKLLVHNHIVKTIPCIDDSSRSSYMADSNACGIAAMTHSNRCISLIDTGLMKRVAHIDGLRRTVWTLCFHPYKQNLLATGNLGGTVCVFDHTKLVRTQSNESQSKSHPITSITFYTHKPVIFYAFLNRIIVWNYEEDTRVKEILASDDTRIKYIKYNAGCDMLITGSRNEERNAPLQINDETDASDHHRLIPCSLFMERLMNTISVLIDNVETNRIVDYTLYWRHMVMQVHQFYSFLGISEQIQSKKFTNDFGQSMLMLKRRVDRIVIRIRNEIVLKQPTDLNTLISKLKHICAIYRSELQEANIVEDFDFSILTDILVTIQGIVDYKDFPRTIPPDEKTPCESHYKLQAWIVNDIYTTTVPDLTQDWRNVITHGYIHNDSTVEISKCGKLMATFREMKKEKYVISVHSLEAFQLGEQLYSYEANGKGTIMSLSFSPSLDYLLVGIRSSDFFGYFLSLPKDQQNQQTNEQIVMLKRGPEHDDVISYLKWAARPGDGIIIGYKTYHLRCLIQG